MNKTTIEWTDYSVSPLKLKRAHCRDVMRKALDELKEYRCMPTPGIVHAKLNEAYRALHVPRAAEVAASGAWRDLKDELLPKTFPTLFERSGVKTLF